MRWVYSSSPVSSSRMDPTNTVLALVGLVFVGSVWSIASLANSWVIVHAFSLTLVLSTSQSGACGMSSFLVWWSMDKSHMVLWVMQQLSILWVMRQPSRSIWLVIHWHVLLVHVLFDAGHPASFLSPLVIHRCWGCHCFVAPPSCLLCLMLFVGACQPVVWVTRCHYPLCLLQFSSVGLVLNLLLLLPSHLTCLLLALGCIYAWRILCLKCMCFSCILLILYGICSALMMLQCSIHWLHDHPIFFSSLVYCAAIWCIPWALKAFW